MINLNSGYLNVLNVKNIPIRLHWTLPIGCLIIGGLNPLTWFLFCFILFIHEGGHAFLAYRRGFQVKSIDLWGMGGMCRWSGLPSQKDMSVIAWGGVIAQTCVLVMMGLVVLLFGYPAGGMLGLIIYWLVKINIFIIIFNLIPIRPLDGYEAWKLLKEWKK